MPHILHPAPQIIELTDGSTLHGKAQALSASQGLEWQHPLARHPVTLISVIWQGSASMRWAVSRLPDNRIAALNSTMVI